MNTVSPLEVARFGVELVGDRRLYERAALEPVLRALGARRPFEPESWGLDERCGLPWDEARALGAAGGRTSPAVLQLQRKKRIAYDAMIGLSDRPYVVVEPKPRTAAKDWPLVFELGDALANAYEPEVGWVHAWAAPPYPMDEAAKARLRIDLGCNGAPNDYQDYGPGGLGMRTYLGPRLVALLGRERIASSPLVCTELPWGGLRVDLVEDPWEATPDALRQAWRAAMDHLEPARVFAELQVFDNGASRATRGVRFVHGSYGRSRT